ncbi:SLC13 family permease [Salinarimonas ramus]|uniref:SLC13 family permease n=1 Tax=Salinarimonas ramus TaxID=690164 RepID=A0A917QAT5_9HYPH|nr:SLC13 family permease [Salinarimonas ramus]GGK39002.1 SLC13 family permease [Salinarimonas ramus]
MTTPQILVLAILACAVALFVWGRWRHDMVAVAALVACVAAGLVSADAAFAGFGHPAVVTVACVLILSRTLQTSGAVELLTQRVLPADMGAARAVATVTALGAFLSAFMNNVGALALLMPLALQIAGKRGLPPSRVLMPLSFGSILGGMTTLIGTPPNLIVAGFRAQATGSGFGMFDFTPVGLAVALAGVVFVVLLAVRLVPDRKRAGADSFETEAYMTEARIPEGAEAAGKTLREIEAALKEADAQVVGLVRHEVRLAAPNPWRKVREGDILVIEAEPQALAGALSRLGLVLEEEMRGREEGSEESGEEAGGETQDADEASARQPVEDEGVTFAELVVLPGSGLAGRSARDLKLRTRHGLNLLAVSRQGERSRARLRTMMLRAGDVLLMQGAPERVAEFAGAMGAAPLAERPLTIPNRRDIALSLTIFAAAIAAAAFGIVPAAIAFAAGVLAAMATRVVAPRSVYNAVDWPVIVLLGALIPVAGAMETTGAADLLARGLLDVVAQGNGIVALVLILVVTMTLSDFMNNAATAAVMAPVAIGAAHGLDASPDPFLMAVAVGASCAFLTPIGHQNNTLILGPAGLKFGDYWKLGLPLEVLVVAVSVPMILLVWPL